MPMRLPLEVRLYASAMLMTLRSWRPTIGRIPTAAAVSIILLAGKQKTASTPSRRSTSATAWLPFMPRSVHRVERGACGSQPQAARGQDRILSQTVNFVLIIACKRRRQQATGSDCLSSGAPDISAAVVRDGYGHGRRATTSRATQLVWLASTMTRSGLISISAIDDACARYPSAI